MVRVSVRVSVRVRRVRVIVHKSMAKYTGTKERNIPVRKNERSIPVPRKE